MKFTEPSKMKKNRNLSLNLASYLKSSVQLCSIVKSGTTTLITTIHTIKYRLIPLDKSTKVNLYPSRLLK